MLIAFGAWAEERRGGTMPGRAAPDGRPFAENLDTLRLDGGGVARLATAGGRVLTARGSATTQRDRHRTLFGEVSLSGTAARQTWVTGAALQRESYEARATPRFEYAHTSPGVFAQDDFTATPWLNPAFSIASTASSTVPL